MSLFKCPHNLALILIISALFSSCEFNLHEIPETKIDYPLEGPPITFKLNNFNDTIKLGWKMNFQYTIQGTNNKIQSVRINFEETEIHHYISDNNQTFTFLFDPSSYNNGYSNLSIEIISSTGTGSIADKVGSEGFLYKLEWPVYIDKTLPVGIANYIISAKQTDKGIELTWPSFNHINFISYEVCRQYSFIQPNAVSIATIYDPMKNEFIDTTFWEGTTCRYHIRINTPAGSLNGEYIWISPSLGGLKATLNNDKTIDVTWDKAKNTASFGKYYVYAGDNSSRIYGTHLIDNIDQNFAKFNFGAFGSSLYIFLKFIPPGVSESDFRYLGYKMIELRIPPIIPVHLSSFSFMGRDFILLASGSAIYRYYPNQLQTTDTLSDNLISSCPMSVSNNGGRFIYYSDGRFYLRQSDNFVLESDFSGPPLAIGSNITYYSLSDNGRVLALDNKGVSYLFDVTNGNLIDQDTLMVDGYNAKTVLISNDGTKMLAITGNLNYPAVFYNLGQQGWIESGRSDNSPAKIFYSTDGASIYVAYTRSIQIRNANNFNVINSYALQYGYFKSVDLKNDRFLWNLVGTGNYIVGNLSSGATIRSLALGPGGSLNLVDNYIINSYGYQLEIQDF